MKPIVRMGALSGQIAMDRILGKAKLAVSFYARDSVRVESATQPWANLLGARLRIDRK